MNPIILPELQYYYNLTIRLLVSYRGHSLRGESYPFAKKQSLYTTAPAWLGKTRNVKKKSSSYRADSTDIPDPLSPLLPIVHRPR